MTKLKKSKKRAYLLLIVTVCVCLSLLVLGFFIKSSRKPLRIVTLPVATPTPIPSPDLTALLADVAIAYPSAPWVAPAVATQQTFYGNLAGAQIQATVTKENAYLQPFISTFDLNKIGFTIDNNLSANGAGSGMWGYKRSINSKSQILLFSYQTKPTSQNSNEPLQFNCPCSMHITVFASTPY